MSFEKDIDKLEDIVYKMESDEITLEEALKLYQDGIELSKKCEKFLQKVDQKIYILKNPEEAKTNKQEKNSTDANFKLFED